MTTCQFCKATTNNPLGERWHQADLDVFVCPACIPAVMRPEPIDATNLSQEELNEIALAKDDYYQRHYSK